MPINHLVKRSNNYYFRKRLPTDIAHYFIKNEVYVALKTSCIHNANFIKKRLLEALENAFHEFRNMLIVKHVHPLLVLVRNPENNRTISIQLALKDDLQMHDTKTSKHASYTMHDGIKTIKIEVDHAGNAEQERETIAKMIQASNGTAIKEDINPLCTVQHAIDEYVASKKAEGILSAKGLEDIERRLGLLPRFFGNNHPISEIKLRDAETFRNCLMKLPPNMNKRKETKGKSLSSIAEMGLKPQSPSTVKGIVEKCSTFFQWAIKMEYIQTNFFYKMRVPQTNKKKENQQRDRWYKNDLNKLFNDEVFTEHKMIKHPYYFWLPLLGLYTGARLNELAQLAPKNIFKKEGHLVLQLTDADEFQKLKNSNSERLVPVHSHLIELGFTEYLEQRQSCTYMFDGLLTKSGKRNRDGMGNNVTKWFKRKRDKLGIVNADFHSFRHTVADELKQKGVPEQQASALLGHKEQTITYARYGKDLNVDLLAKTVAELDFTDVLKNVKRWG